MTERLLTAREVAERVGVSTETILRWVRRGELTAIRLPSGALRFPEPMLVQWLTERATPGRGALTTTPGAAVPTLPSSVLTTTEDEE